MDANEYQDRTASTELYSGAAEVFVGTPTDHQRRWLEIAYCTGKLNGEAGEVAELVFKAFRGEAGNLSGEQKVKLQKELGDVLWYVARLADLIGVPLSVIMEDNLAKLQDRKDRGVVHGYGSQR